MPAGTVVRAGNDGCQTKAAQSMEQTCADAWHGRGGPLNVADLMRTATGQGYLDARFTRSDLTINKEDRRATISLAIETGQRYFFGPITVQQDAILDSAMQRLLRIHQGDPYSVDALLRTQYVLDDTQYFANVEIETAERDRERLIVPVTIRAKPNQRHRYAASVGYATDTKARGRLTWDNRRVNTQGHRWQVGLIGSGTVDEASFRYIIPVMDIALEKLEFSLIARNEELGDTLSKKQELGTGLTQVFGKWQRVLFLELDGPKTRQVSLVSVATQPLED